MEKRYDEIVNFLSREEYPKDGELFFGPKKAVKSKEEAMMIFREMHSSPLGGHTGMKKTRAAVSSRFYWLGMTIDIENWTLECDQCQKVGKPLPAPQPLQCIKVSAVWELVGIDLTGPLPKTKDDFKYILTATDYFSKWVEAYPLKSKTAAEVGQHLCSMIYHYGCPKRILSDQGREFVNELNDRMCSLLGIERSVTAAYHPQTNGLDEKTNDNIKRALSKLVNEKQNNWDLYLEPTLFSLRSKVQTTTKHSPFLLMHGREAVFPSEVPVDLPLTNIIMPEERTYETFMAEKNTAMETVKESTRQNISKSQAKQKLAYQKKVQKKYKSLSYSLGDEVLLYNIRKRGRKGGRMEADFFGPYVIKAMSGKLVTLSNSDGVALKNRFNVDHIKPYIRANAKSTENICTPVSSVQQRPSVICFATRQQDVPIQQSAETSLNIQQSIEDRVNMLWTAADDGSVEAVVGPYTLYVSSFHTLRGTEWLGDEVIDAYLHHLLANHQEPVWHMSAVVSTALFSGQMQRLGKVKFPKEDLWICPVNFASHWILVVYIVKQS